METVGNGAAMTCNKGRTQQVTSKLNIRINEHGKITGQTLSHVLKGPISWKQVKQGPFFCVFLPVLHPTAVTHFKALQPQPQPPSSPLFPLLNWNVKHDQKGFCSFLYGNEVKPKPGCLQPHPNTFIYHGQGLGAGLGEWHILISSLTVPVCPLPPPFSNLLYEYESAATSPL